MTRRVIAGMCAWLDDRAGFTRAAAPLFLGAGLPGVRVSDALLDCGVGMAMRTSAHATVAMVDAYSNEDCRPDLANARVPGDAGRRAATRQARVSAWGAVISKAATTS